MTFMIRLNTSYYFLIGKITTVGSFNKAWASEKTY